MPKKRVKPKKKKAAKSSAPKKRVKNKKKTVGRISTGVKNFDKLIEGGFEKNSTNLLVGSSGSGKSIFAAQFLVEGIKKGENCLYITFEEKKDEFYNNMLEFGWDLAKSESSGKFTFLEYTPEKVKTMLEEGGGLIESIILKKKIKRIVIDSITSFELLFEHDIEKREAALSLFSILRKWDCTSLLTYEGDPLREKKASSRTLEFESDSITFLYFVRVRGERERFLEVVKMRGTRHSRRVYPFSITGKGVVISGRPSAQKI